MKLIAFVLRGCPAGWLGAYGNEWVATPHLDRLASRAVIFDRHYSDCPDPAAASRAWLGERGRILAALRTAGIHTVLVRANHPDTDLPDWFYADWAEVFDARPVADDDSPLDALMRSFPGLLDRLAAVPNFLLWVEIDRLLPPWDVPREVFEAYWKDEEDSPAMAGEEVDEEPLEEVVEEVEEVEEPPSESVPTAAEVEAVPPWDDPPIGPFDGSDGDALKWLHDSFASVVTTLDAELGVIFQALIDRGLDSKAAWLVTSDFGFPLGEHGQIGVYRPWLHEELVHLPLVLQLPGASPRRVAGLTQPADVGALLREYFQRERDGESRTVSLLALARGEAAQARSAANTALDLGVAAEQSIRTEDWAYLRPVRVPEGEQRDPQLFEKPEDRWEVNDLRAQNQDRAEEFERNLPSKPT